MRQLRPWRSCFFTQESLMENWVIQLGQTHIPFWPTVLTYCGFTAIIIARYFAIVWPIHHMLWNRDPAKVNSRRLSKREPTSATIRNEIKLSTISAFIYALPAAIVTCSITRAGKSILIDGSKAGLAKCLSPHLTIICTIRNSRAIMGCILDFGTMWPVQTKAKFELA